MKTKSLTVFLSLLFFVLLYQNCAHRGQMGMHREVRLESKASVNVADKNGKAFLKWNFYPGVETSVEIVNADNSFCKRGFILSAQAEKEWSYTFSDLKPNRVTASQSIKSKKNIKIDYKGKLTSLSMNDSKPFFDLMEKTKRNHNIRITECEGKKKWGFKNIKVESIIKTKSNSKVVQTFKLKVNPNSKIEMNLEEQPIKIATDKQEAFCTYSGMTYEPSSKLLTVMFNLDEFNKNQNLNGSRGLASAANEVMIIQIDGKTKYSIDENSMLGINFRTVINQMKTAKAARKTCGYTY